jgi:hypothetical protein
MVVKVLMQQDGVVLQVLLSKLKAAIPVQVLGIQVKQGFVLLQVKKSVKDDLRLPPPPVVAPARTFLVLGRCNWERVLISLPPRCWKVFTRCVINPD